jgi:hypothetical protein
MDLLKMLLGCTLYAVPMGLLISETNYTFPQETGGPPPLPEGSQEFKPDGYTQSVYQLYDRDRIDRVSRAGLEAHWHTSGGMVGIAGVVSKKYRLVPAGGWSKVGTIQVLNSRGYSQPVRAIVRHYPDGSRFDDVLYYQGQVFEHRVRIKAKGVWKSSIIYTDVSARPPGYAGLKQSCSSCHDQAGTGKYASDSAPGLVPGGDGVISDPLDWRVLVK